MEPEPAAMSALFRAILMIHITFAVASALTFWVPLCTPKGGRVHVRFGRVYLVLILLATATSIALTAVRYAEGVRGTGTGLPLDAMTGDPEIYRLFLGFLAFIALATAGAALGGVRSLHGTKPRPVDAAAHAILALLGLLAAAAGVHASSPPMIAVGAAGALLGVYQARAALRRSPSRVTRLRDHLTGMLASGIGAYSALAVVIGNRLAPEFFHGRFGVIIWLIPALLGLPVLFVVRARIAHSRT